MKSYVAVTIALLATSVVAQNLTNGTNNTNATKVNSTISTCTKGDDTPCAKISTDYCCAYIKSGSVEAYSCAPQSTFETLKSVAKAANVADYDIHCANAVLAKISGAVLAVFSVAQLF